MYSLNFLNVIVINHILNLNYSFHKPKFSSHPCPSFTNPYMYDHPPITKPSPLAILLLSSPLTFLVSNPTKKANPYRNIIPLTSRHINTHIEENARTHPYTWHPTYPPYSHHFTYICGPVFGSAANTCVPVHSWWRWRKLADLQSEKGRERTLNFTQKTPPSTMYFICCWNFAPSSHTILLYYNMLYLYIPRIYK